MKKRIFSIVLVICMLLSLLPASALAARWTTFPDATAILAI